MSIIFDEYIKKHNKNIHNVTKDLSEIHQDFIDNTDKIHKNLVAFIGKSEKNIENALNYHFKNKENIEKENKVAQINLKESEKSNIYKLEKKIDILNKKHENYKRELSNTIKYAYKEYDEFLTKQTDDLEEETDNNSKILQEYINSIENDEQTQIKEFDETIASLEEDIKNVNADYQETIMDIKQSFIFGTSSHNDQIKNVKKLFNNNQNDLNESIAVHKQNLEEAKAANHKVFLKIQKQIINKFRDELIESEKMMDSIPTDDQIHFATEMAKIRSIKLRSEAEKNHKVKLAKINSDYQDSMAEIEFETNVFNMNNAIKRELLKTNIEITNAEHLISLEALNRDNALDKLSINHTHNTNNLNQSINIKNFEVQNFREKIDSLKAHKINEITYLDRKNVVSSSLTIQKKKFKAEYEEKRLLEVKKEKEAQLNFNIELANQENEFENKLINSDYDRFLINSEVKAVESKYDYELFKENTNIDIDQSRLDNILSYFKSRTDYELDCLKSSTRIIFLEYSLLKETIIKKLSDMYHNFDKSKFLDYKNDLDEQKTIINKTLGELENFISEKMDIMSDDSNDFLENYLEKAEKRRQFLAEELDITKLNIEAADEKITSFEQEINYLEVNKATTIKTIQKISQSQLANKSENIKALRIDLNDIVKAINYKRANINILNQQKKMYNQKITSATQKLNELLNDTNIYADNVQNPLFKVKFMNFYFEKKNLILKYINDLRNKLIALFANSFSKSKKEINRLINANSTLIDKNFNRINSINKKISASYEKQFLKIKDLYDDLSFECDKERQQKNQKISKEKKISILEIRNRLKIIDSNILNEKNKHNINVNKLKKDLAYQLKAIRDDQKSLRKDHYNMLKSVDENLKVSTNYYNKLLDSNNLLKSNSISKIDKARINKKIEFENNIFASKKNLNKIILDLDIIFKSKKNEIAKKYRMKILEAELELKRFDKDTLNESKVYKKNKALLDKLVKKKYADEEENFINEISSIRSTVNKKLKQDKKRIKKASKN